MMEYPSARSPDGELAGGHSKLHSISLPSGSMPSCPSELDPQQATEPLLSTVQVWSPPAESVES